ncbi:hypothetical protein DSECCO2_449540 [anaerobic digester metagenome]
MPVRFAETEALTVPAAPSSVTTGFVSSVIPAIVPFTIPLSLVGAPSVSMVRVKLPSAIRMVVPLTVALAAVVLMLTCGLPSLPVVTLQPGMSSGAFWVWSPCGRVTVTMAVPVTSPYAAVTVVVPGALAVKRPAVFRVPTVPFELVQATVTSSTTPPSVS